ncbi:MAG: NAD(P)/FAD-dependent oxidoreductase, partial [Acidobacteriales bacterium]|nr:NAD(P)/FAD-dependent oxidoreductase [Terriglobales bacterium]
MTEIAIVGAGPYGLSIAAHLRKHGIPFRIFGHPMDSWRAHMPKGMLLKSDGFASDIYDPDRSFTLREYCAGRQIDYADTGLPVSRETFTDYGVAFQQRLVPELEEKNVVGIEQVAGEFRLRLDDGETLESQRVILAVGITHFEHTPTSISQLPPQFLSHSFRHHDLESFRGRRVVVLGGGSSAIDLAGLLKEAGSDVQLVARRPSLRFHSEPHPGKPTPWWRRMRHPQSGLGPGWRSRFFANSPELFYYLPERLRLEAVRKSLGPSAGWFAKKKMENVPVWLGVTVQSADVAGGEVRLRLLAANGSQRELLTEHIIAATGYKVDMARLTFLSAGIRSALKTVDGTPILSPAFESSLPGLYFVGIAAAKIGRA